MTIWLVNVYLKGRVILTSMHSKVQNVGWLPWPLAGSCKLLVFLVWIRRAIGGYSLGDVSIPIWNYRQIVLTMLNSMDMENYMPFVCPLFKRALMEGDRSTQFPGRRRSVEGAQLQATRFWHRNRPFTYTIFIYRRCVKNRLRDLQCWHILQLW